MLQKLSECFLFLSILVFCLLFCNKNDQFFNFLRFEFYFSSIIFLLSLFRKKLKSNHIIIWKIHIYVYLMWLDLLKEIASIFLFLRLLHFSIRFSYVELKYFYKIFKILQKIVMNTKFVCKNKNYHNKNNQLVKLSIFKR